MAKSKDQVQVPLNSLLKIGIPASIVIIIAIVSGIYKLATYISHQNIDTLKTSLDQRTQEVKNLEKKVNEIGANISPQKAQTLPQVTLDATEDAQSMQKLADRISELEKERVQLTQQLSQKAINSLDPESELPILLKQLKSEKAEVRKEAITGLFVLKNNISFSPLVAFFKENLKEATSGYNPSISEWYEFFFELDPHATLELLVEALDSQDEWQSYIAYLRIEKFVKSVELFDFCRPLLVSLALRSPNSSARTRAKVMLEKLSERRAELIANGKEKEDERSQREILLNIEKLIQSSIIN